MWLCIIRIFLWDYSIFFNISKSHFYIKLHHTYFYFQIHHDLHWAQYIKWHTREHRTLLMTTLLLWFIRLTKECSLYLQGDRWILELDQVSWTLYIHWNSLGTSLSTLHVLKLSVCLYHTMLFCFQGLQSRSQQTSGLALKSLSDKKGSHQGMQGAFIYMCIIHTIKSNSVTTECFWIILFPKDQCSGQHLMHNKLINSYHNYVQTQCIFIHLIFSLNQIQ